MKNTIINGDNADVMKQMPDCSIDLVVTSPPYDDLREYGGHSWDFQIVAKELNRILKPGGIIVWVVGDKTENGSETGTSMRQALFFLDNCKLNLHDTMIYQKAGCPFPETTRYYPVWEYMFVFSKGKPKAINLIADHKNNWYGQKTARLHSERQKNGLVIENSSYRIAPNREIKEYGIRDNVWKYSIGRGNTTTDNYAFEHPAMFPYKLAVDHIISWSNPGDIVLDPFAGSGTVLKAAKELNRDYVGIEINPKYFEICKIRVSQEVLQLETKRAASMPQEVGQKDNIEGVETHLTTAQACKPEEPASTH